MRYTHARTTHTGEGGMKDRRDPESRELYKGGLWHRKEKIVKKKGIYILYISPGPSGPRSHRQATWLVSRTKQSPPPPNPFSKAVGQGGYLENQLRNGGIRVFVVVPSKSWMTVS